MPSPSGLPLDQSLPRASALKRRGWQVAAFLLLYLTFVSFPSAAVTPALDSSWCGAIIHFAAKRLQWGKQVIFPYGPFGHLVAFVYTGELFWVRFAWEIIAKALFAGVVCFTMRRLAVKWQIALVVYVALFIWADPVSDALFLLVLSCLALSLLDPDEVSRLLPLVAGLLFAVSALVKFTHFFFALFVVLLCLCEHIRRGQYNRLFLFVGSFIFCFLISWLLAGQQLGSFIPYVASSMEVSAGYKEAMGLPCTSVTVFSLGLAELFLAAAIAIICLFDIGITRAATLAILIAGAAFLSWNRAFVRADNHVLSFFAFCPALIIMATAGLRSSRTDLAKIAAIVAATAGMLSQNPHLPGQIAQTPRLFWARPYSILNPLGLHASLEAQLAAARETFRLPRITNAIGQKTVDVFGQEQGIALLNQLHYTPRPVFQSYTAYSKALIASNAAFYDSKEAPDFVLAKYQPIDGRYPTSEDSSVLLELIYRYQPILQERGYTLWQRRKDSQAITAQSLSSETIRFWQEVPLPNNQAMLMTVHPVRRIYGRVLSMLFRPPSLQITTANANKRNGPFKLVPSLGSVPFIISPRLEKPHDLLDFAVGGGGERVESFCVTRAHNDWFYRDKLRVEFFGLPRMIPAENLSAAEVVGRKVTFSPSTTFDGLTAANGVVIAKEADALRATVTGADPLIELPALRAEGVRECTVTIDIDSPATTDAVLVYDVCLGSGKHETRSLSQPVAVGRSRIQFAVSDGDATGRLSLIPGLALGNYRLFNLEITSRNPLQLETDNAAETSSEMRQEFLRNAFESSKEVLLDLEPKTSYEGIAVANQAMIEATREGLRISAQGDDPQLLLPNILTRTHSRVVFRVRIDSPVETGLQVFYIPPGQCSYGADVIDFGLRRGPNELYFELNDATLANGHLRLDPGMAAGKYVLRQLIAKGL